MQSRRHDTDGRRHESPRHESLAPSQGEHQRPLDSPLRIFAPKEAATSGSKEPTPVSSREQRELDRLSGVAPARTVTITLGQMVPLVTDAAEKNRLWLTDFSDEPVRIDADLYEVLLAYQRMSRRDAA